MLQNMSDSDDDSTAEVDLNNLPREVDLKILVLGDLGVGKSSLIKKYCKSDSGPEYKVSVEVSQFIFDFIVISNGNDFYRLATPINASTSMA